MVQMNEITKISSRENTKLGLARKVRDGKFKVAVVETEPKSTAK